MLCPLHKAFRDPRCIDREKSGGLRIILVESLKGVCVIMGLITGLNRQVFLPGEKICKFYFAANVSPIQKTISKYG